MPGDVYPGLPATGRMLPSPSAGMLRGSTGNPLDYPGLWDTHRPQGLIDSWNANASAISRPSTTKVDLLTSPGTPPHYRHKAPPPTYYRHMTPEDQTDLRSQVVAHLRHMAAASSRSFKPPATAPPRQYGSTTAPPAFEHYEGRLSSHNHRPMTSGHLSGAPHTSPHAPPPSTTFTKHLRPSHSTSQLDPAVSFAPEARSLSSLSAPASWPGPADTWPHPSQPTGPDTARRTQTSVTSSTHLDVLPDPSAFDPTTTLRRSCPAAPLTPSRLSDLWTNPAASSKPAGGLLWDCLFGHDVNSAPRNAIGTKAANVTGSLQDFSPTRGHMYCVFAEMDQYDSGKVTLAAFEEAAFKVGLRTEQAKRFFNMLDKKGLGFITMKDWGAREKERQVLNFTRLYIKQARTSAKEHVKEAATLQMAMEMAMYKLSLKRNGRSINGRRIKEAFDFIDANSNGTLDREEIADAFCALGIHVHPSVVDKALKVFDTNDSGSVDYDEFLRTLYPTLSKSAYNQLITLL